MKATSVTPVLCLLYLTIWYSGAGADRLIRRSDAQILTGVGIIDEKKQTVSFRRCNDKDEKIYNLKEYVFQSGKDCERPEIFISGKVSIESTSIAAGIGVSWGAGKLTFKGQDYPFSVDGLSLVDWGISKASAVGDVYNLTDVVKFAGDYVAAEAGFALAGGIGGMVLRNQNGVIIQLRSVSQGAKLQLGPSGLSIKLK